MATKQYKKENNNLSDTKIKTRLSKFYRSVLKRKTPLLSFTVLELSILFLFITTAVVASALLFLYKPSIDAPKEETSISENMSGTKTSPQTNTSNQQSASQQQSGAQPNTGSDNQSDCRREEIPYKTTYQNVSYLQKGQTSEGGGMNGSSLDCGDGNPTILNPVDKIVYVGTGLTDEEIQQQQIAAQQEYDKKYMQWLLTRNNAYQSCMNSLPSSYPSKVSYCTNYASQQAGQPPQQP